MADKDPATTPKEDAIVQIYDKLNELFGNKASQLFVMEYPGRILDIGTYAYEGSDGHNAQQVKPQSVVEAEFRLSDDLFSLGEITGGHNGAKVCLEITPTCNGLRRHLLVLPGLVPNGSSATAYETKTLPDQDLIAEWLVEAVPDWTPPPTDVLSSILPQEVHKHIEKPKKPSDDDQSTSIAANFPLRWCRASTFIRNFWMRTVAINGPVVEEKLQALWTTLIVRGNYHRVRHYIGLVDVESSSEALLAAKASMRESVMRSIDQTQDIYPVQFSPATWANYLTTDFEPVDLLMDPKLQRTHLFELQSQRRSLLDHKALLESAQTGNDELKKLEVEMNRARSEYTVSKIPVPLGLKEHQSSSTSSATRQEELKSRLNIFLSKQLMGKPAIQLSDADFDKFARWQGCEEKSAKLQSNLTDASESYSRVAGQVSGAKASDNTLAILQISRRIEALTDTIEELKRVLGSVDRGKNLTGYNDKGEEEEDSSVGTKADGSALPPAKLKTGASMWQT
ncbi:hypothetical protein B0H14DRAFT_2653519, partial [Mycena olivaceomarginata]